MRDRTNLDVSVIDEQTAADLFRAFKTDATYAWGYRPDGCAERATKMARVAEARGVSFAKVFAGGRLRVLPPGPVRPDEQRWSFHVAPVAFVRSVADGKETVELRVFDPALFARPVSLAEWKEQLRSRGDLDRKEDARHAVTALSNAENRLNYRRPLAVKDDAFEKPEVEEIYFGSRFQQSRRTSDRESRDAWNEKEVAEAEQVLKLYRLRELGITNQFRSSDVDSPIVSYGTKGVR